MPPSYFADNELVTPILLFRFVVGVRDSWESHCVTIPQWLLISKIADIFKCIKDARCKWCIKMYVSMLSSQP